jgi:hypothetical protein
MAIADEDLSDANERYASLYFALIEEIDQLKNRLKSHYDLQR